MRKKIKIPLFYISAAIVVLSLLAGGCGIFGDNAGEALPEDAQVQEEEAAVDDEPQPGLVTTITLWNYLEPGERMALMGSRDKFLSANSDINLETRHFRSQEELEDQFEAASLAGAGPQILLIDFEGVNRLAPSNVVKEIGDQVDYGFALDGLREISSYEGRDYIVPFRAYDLLMLFYNKDIVENVPRDFEEVFAYIEQVAAEVGGEEGDQYGFLLNERQADWIIPFVGGYNGWIIDYASGSLTLDSPAMRKTLEFLDYSYNQTGILEGGMEYGDINEQFKAGAAHMIIDYYSMVEEYTEAGVDVGLAKIPRVWEGTRFPTPIVSGLGFMINVNTYGEQLDACREFISFMLLQEIQDDWDRSTMTLTALTGLESSSNAFVMAGREQAEISRGKPHEQVLMVIRNAINDNVESLLAGDIIPEDAVLKIQEDAIRLRSGALPRGSSQEEGLDEDGASTDEETGQ